MSQERGIVGLLVGAMIRRSVRTRYRRVSLVSPHLVSGSMILYANHHSWMDGYLMFHVVQRLKLESVDWIEEFDAFPLFRYVGGLRFSRDDGAARAATIRKTLRWLSAGKSLVIFPEGVLHRPPDLLPFGRALDFVARRSPTTKLAPVAIYQEQSMHERPEAWISVGKPHSYESDLDCEGRLRAELEALKSHVCENFQIPTLVEGTPDVNERWKLSRK